MNLRTKTILAILATFSIVMTIATLFAFLFFLESFKSLELNEIQEQAAVFHYVLDHELDNLAKLTNDWAAWDDTYEFIQDQNSQYIQSNLVDSTFIDLGINFVLYFDQNGKIIIEKAFDLEENQQTKLNEKVLTLLTNQIRQSDHTGFTGYLSDNNIPVLYAGMPILTSLQEGPSLGTVIFGKYLQGNLYEHVTASLESNLVLLPYNANTISALEEISSKPMLFADRSDRKIIHFYSVIEDASSTPLVLVKQSQFRTIFQRGLDSMRDLLISVAIAGLIASIISIFALEKGFLSRLSQLSNGVKGFAASKSNGKEMLLKGKDELADLSRTIYGALNSLATTQKELAGHLSFERLLVSLSTKFINLPIEKLDDGINQVLEIIGNYAQADRSYLLLLRETNPFIMDNPNEWCSSGTISVMKKMQNMDVRQFPWWFNQMIDGKSVCINDIQKMPVKAKPEKEIFIEQSIKSIVNSPLFISGELIGFLGFDAVQKKIAWNDQVVILLEVIGNMIANALDRRRHEQDLIANQHQQARLNQITRESIMKSDIDSTCRSLSRKIRTIIDADNGVILLSGDRGHPEIYISGKKQKPNHFNYRFFENILLKTDGKVKVFHTRNQSNKTDFNTLGKSLIAVPLTSNKESLGLAIYCFNKHRNFSVKEKILCQQAAPYITLAIIKNRALESARQRLNELNALRATIADITSELEIKNLLETILERAVKLLNADGGDFCVFDEQKNALKIVAIHNMSEQYMNTWVQIGEGAAGKAASRRKTVILEDYSSWKEKMDDYEEANLHGAMVTPLVVGGRLLGTVGIFHYNKTKKFSREDQHLLALFAQHASIALDNAILFEKVERMARYDELTGQLNRRAFKDIGDYEINRAIRLKQPIALAMIDLDNFKHINDTYSHQIGDDALREVSKILRENIRNIDIIGRYGGDESIIIMPGTDINNAASAMERLRKSIDNHLFEIHQHAINIQASIGLVSYSSDPPTLEEMIARADEAMYLAKNSGKNRVCVFQKQE